MEEKELCYRGSPPEMPKNFTVNTTAKGNHQTGPKLPDEDAPKRTTTADQPLCRSQDGAFEKGSDSAKPTSSKKSYNSGA
jgi:hypothetical protein